MKIDREKEWRDRDRQKEIETETTDRARTFTILEVGGEDCVYWKEG